MKHTKGKWEAHFPFNLDGTPTNEASVTTDTRRICDISHGETEEGKANAKRIVHCVNNFDDMLNTLKELTDAANDYDDNYGYELEKDYQKASGLLNTFQSAIESSEELIEKIES